MNEASGSGMNDGTSKSSDYGLGPEWERKSPTKKVFTQRLKAWKSLPVAELRWYCDELVVEFKQDDIEWTCKELARTKNMMPDGNLILPQAPDGLPRTPAKKTKPNPQLEDPVSSEEDDEPVVVERGGLVDGGSGFGGTNRGSGSKCCGKIVTSKFCCECGKQVGLRLAVCLKCGLTLNEAKFCGECGTQRGATGGTEDFKRSHCEGINDAPDLQQLFNKMVDVAYGGVATSTRGMVERLRT